MAKKKTYNSKNIASVWMNTNKKTGEDFVSVNLVDEVDKNGKENKYFAGNLFFQDAESGSLYKINKLKTFENDNHESILANICVELDDEEYSELVTDKDE